MIDNYDSFTYNLVQAFQVLGAEVEVHRNDQVKIADLVHEDFTHMVISPGPGRPEDAGISMELLEVMMGTLPIMGVCLGHQCLAQLLGGSVVSAPRLMHGKSSPVYHDSKGLYAGLPNPFVAGRYHSLAVAEEDLPSELEIVAYTSDGEIMGLRHRAHCTLGVQFHPESILTPQGDRLLENFIRMEVRP
jgi:anthranilate synthase/aminodeoxychorismate synthase-like glutamine amidotransferase